MSFWHALRSVDDISDKTMSLQYVTSVNNFMVM